MSREPTALEYEVLLDLSARRDPWKRKDRGLRPLPARTISGAIGRLQRNGFIFLDAYGEHDNAGYAGWVPTEEARDLIRQRSAKATEKA